MQIVTVPEKTWHIGFFVKVEFYLWLISSTIELTRVLVSDQLCALLSRYSALFVIVRQLRNYGPKALLCTRMAFHILLVTWKSIKWTWAEPFEMNVKMEQELNFIVDDDS